MTLLLCLAVSVLGFSGSALAQFGEVIAFESPGNTTYYLDAETGDDENPGTRTGRAWKSLSRVNSTRFAGGDRLLIKAGTVYEGRLWPKGTGRPGVPVVIDSYGEGPMPAIHAGGETGEALLLENTQGWHINNLELTNTGDKPEAFRFGLSITVEDMGSAGDFKLTNLYVHDVNGAEEPGLGEGAGIIWRSRGAGVATRFEKLLIEHCRVEDCGRNGIMSLNEFADRTRWFAHVDIVIRENDVTGVVGDGIRLTGSANAIVEYNRIHKAGGGKDGQAGGIVLTGCDNTLVQYNEVWETAGAKNAALLSDTNNRDNTFQYNYTHNNAGPMARVRSAAIAGSGEKPAVDAGNAGSAVRYNISQDDGGALSVIGPVREARFHNNTIYNGPDSMTRSVVLTDKAGPPAETTVANNLFYTLGSASMDLAQAPDTTIQHNAYFGEHLRPDGETGAVTALPLLVKPGSGTSMKDGLEGYQTQPDSPLRSAGTRLGDHGNHDFWANRVPRGQVVDIGAYQGSSDNEK